MKQKDFKNWIVLKENLHSFEHKPPFVREGEIWWASIGENVGSEINGKGDLFSRPVLIFKKLSHTAFLVIPMTTQKKEGTWYSSFLFSDKNVTANLSQIRMIDYRRLSSKLGETDDEALKKIKQDIKILLNL